MIPSLLQVTRQTPRRPRPASPQPPPAKPPLHRRTPQSLPRTPPGRTPGSSAGPSDPPPGSPHPQASTPLPRRARQPSKKRPPCGQTHRARLQLETRGQERAVGKLGALEVEAPLTERKGCQGVREERVRAWAGATPSRRGVSGLRAGRAARGGARTGRRTREVGAPATGRWPVSTLGETPPSRRKPLVPGRETLHRGRSEPPGHRRSHSRETGRGSRRREGRGRGASWATAFTLKGCRSLAGRSCLLGAREAVLLPVTSEPLGHPSANIFKVPPALLCTELNSIAAEFAV